MIDIREATIVRHQLKPEWGAGVVVSAPSDGKCDFRFEGCGLMRLQIMTAGRHLEVLAPSDLPTDSPLLDKKRWAEIGTVPKAKKPRVTCEHCKKRLTANVYDGAKGWKSCPTCSTKNGQQHVFRAYPADFQRFVEGSADASSGEAQNECIACQTGQTPADAGKSCNSFTA